MSQLRLERRCASFVVVGAVLSGGCAAAPSAPREPAPCPVASAAPSATPPDEGTPAIPHDLPRTGEFLPPPPALPGASAQASVHSILTVDIDKAGALAANGTPVAHPDELTRIAREALAKDPEVRAIIRADAAVSWGAVIGVLDRLKQGGIAKLAFGVSPVPGP